MAGPRNLANDIVIKKITEKKDMFTCRGQHPTFYPSLLTSTKRLPFRPPLTRTPFTHLRDICLGMRHFSDISAWDLWKGTAEVIVMKMKKIIILLLEDCIAPNVKKSDSLENQHSISSIFFFYVDLSTKSQTRMWIVVKPSQIWHKDKLVKNGRLCCANLQTNFNPVRMLKELAFDFYVFDLNSSKEHG